MRIGVDLRSLQGDDRFRGIGAYLSGLLAALARIDNDNRYSLFLWPPGAPETLVPPLLPHRVVTLRRRLRVAMLNTVRNHLLRDIRISKSDLDMFVQPNIAYGLPRSEVPVIAVAYDLIPLVFRDQYYPPYVTKAAWQAGVPQVVRGAVKAWSIRWQYEWQHRQLLAADHIIAISGATRDDLLRRVSGTHPQKITVIPPGCDPIFRPLPGREGMLARFGIDRPFLLYVGGVDFRKNVPALLSAYDSVREAGCDIQLVLVGTAFRDDRQLQATKILQWVEASAYRGDIVRAGFVERGDLAAIYSAALALVFPSLYEGFGLPALEAMACGCPVIAYRHSSMPEVVGTAGILLDASDDLATAILNVVRDERLRRRMSMAGVARASHFSWDASARAFLDVFRAVREARMLAAVGRRPRTA